MQRGRFFLVGCDETEERAAELIDRGKIVEVDAEHAVLAIAAPGLYRSQYIPRLHGRPFAPVAGAKQRR